MADTYQSKYTGTEIDERLEWAEGINPHMEDKDNPHEVTAAQAGALSTTDAGDLAELTTTEKGSLVGAINEVDDHADTNATSIGTLASLTTTEKTNLVGAINELDTDKVETSAITNTLTETAAGKVLDARQGKALSDKIGTQTFTEDNYVTDGQSATASIDALDMAVKDTADLVSTNKEEFDTHLADEMPHLMVDHKTGKTYKYGEQIGVDGKPQLIYEEVV